MPRGTDLEGLLAAVGQLDPNDGAVLVQAADLGYQIEAALANPDLLRSVGAAIGRVAREHGCQGVKGASTAGNYLAAAAATIDGELIVVIDQAALTRVLVVDHLLVTGFSLRVAAQAALNAGAREVFGCVLASVPNAEPPLPMKEVTAVGGG
jgi:adenine/guanine phosphoribosyltransferase-like PRPP-binding protein